jgi:signal transduction histidine kinase/ligand-binding sensor domain-containing protein
MGLAAAERPPRLPPAQSELAAEVVTSIYQDRAGFLWIGSRAGLILYDGHASIVFEHDASDPSSIVDNAIRTVFEDRRGFLWIGTNAGGLDRLDRTSWTFQHHRHDSSDPRSLAHDSVYAVVEDRDGRFWVGTQGGLNRLDPSSGRFERFPAGPAGPRDDYVAGLHLDREGALWIATVGGGLARRDPTTGGFTSFRHDPAAARSLPADSVFGIAEDGQGRLWLATSNGPGRMDPRAGSFDGFRLPGAADPRTQITTGIAVDADGGVWATSLTAGLFRYDAATDRFEAHPFRSGIPGATAERIVALSADRQGNVWVGTWGAGLGRVSPRARSVGTLAGGARDGDITAVLEDSRGRLWLGSTRNIVWADDHAGASTAVPGTPLSLCEDRQGDVWIGSTGGLSRFHVARGVLEPVTTGGGTGWVWALHVDRRGRLWLGSGGGGLHRRREDGTFERFVHDAADPNSLSDDYVTSILEDGRGTLWVGTRSGGLSAFDETAGRWTRHRPDPLDERSLSHHNVTALLEGRDGSVWVGTGGAGVNRVDRGLGTPAIAFTRFSEKDGLIDDNVVSLAEDADGTVWVGTRRGLSRFDPRRRVFVNYGADDGLASVELQMGAASRGRSRIYFGTHRGVVVVPQGTPFLDPRPAPTVLTSLRTPSGPIATDRPPWEASRIELPYGRVVSFEFTTLDYGDHRRHRYAYRLEPSNDEWIDLGARRDITFTGLDPGAFTLRVRGRTDQGVWSETAPPLAIRVIPPFWMTLWFRLLAAGAFVALGVAAHVVRTASLQRRNRELVELKEQRERALEEARTSQQALGEAYQRLRGLTARLTAAKEEERAWIARELHDEMGTGLTTTKLMLELLAGARSADDRERSVREAIGLLDRMIDRVRTLSLDLRPPLLDELGLAAALRGYVESLARRAQLEITLETPDLPARVPDELGIVGFRVVQEALTNVVRHAQARRAAVVVRYAPGGLDIRVTDDGSGFDVVETLERSPAGGHAGLLGMKERVEAMGGELHVRAAAGRGTEIQARLPLSP